MYCPKCRESFEEGSRRFCPSDGSRLISESDRAASDEGGIFANLIPKIDGLKDLKETRPAPPQFVITEREPSSPITTGSGSQMDGVFFELDEIELDLSEGSELLGPAKTEPAAVKPAADKPAARKVNPREIPAGHVDLRSVDRSSAVAINFDESDPEDFVGRIVKGRYKVMEFLGGDESGLAYLAHDQIVVDKKVLVRILTGREQDEIMDSILTEERVSLSHFSHPNIARLIDSGQFNNGPNFLISEYVDALSIADILTIHGHFSAERTSRVIRQAANALGEAHQEGILHRDLRPENLIITSADGESDQTKLVNFGASSGEPNPQNIGYKAHEVLSGRIATISSDIFSLAVVGYQMLTGQMPFTGSAPRDIVRSQQTGLQLMPSDVRPELSVAVNAVFTKAFSYNAADRYVKARELGDALHATLAAESPVPAESIPLLEIPVRQVTTSTETLKPLVPAPVIETPVVSPPPVEPVEVSSTPVRAEEPAWKNRSPEPPQAENSRTKTLALVSILVLLGLVAAIWYYMVNAPTQSDAPGTAENTSQTGDTAPPITAANTEMPPLPRNVPQPANTNFYQNTKQNLKGDLLQNFVGFTLYYPKDWQVNDPQSGQRDKVRGKFLDISKSTPEGDLQEQMLVSYYPSKGTFGEDGENFRQMVNETNSTLKAILPGYQMTSEGEIKLNGGWRAYEVKFQAGGSSPSGEKLLVWGRRLFIPAARPGTRNGFAITMLATSNAENVRGVDDVGVRGELASILYSFEPSQNF